MSVFVFQPRQLYSRLSGRTYNIYTYICIYEILPKKRTQRQEHTYIHTCYAKKVLGVKKKTVRAKVQQNEKRQTKFYCQLVGVKMKTVTFDSVISANFYDITSTQMNKSTTKHAYSCISKMTCMLICLFLLFFLLLFDDILISLVSWYR